MAVRACLQANDCVRATATKHVNCRHALTAMLRLPSPSATICHEQHNNVYRDKFWLIVAYVVALIKDWSQYVDVGPI